VHMVGTSQLTSLDGVCRRPTRNNVNKRWAELGCREAMPLLGYTFCWSATATGKTNDCYAPRWKNLVNAGRVGDGTAGKGLRVVWLWLGVLGESVLGRRPRSAIRALKCSFSIEPAD
jgi:hypothetical protein